MIEQHHISLISIKDLSTSYELEYNENQAESLPKPAIQSDLSSAYLQDRDISSMSQADDFEEEDIQNYITPMHLSKLVKNNFS
ncbi:MAG: hypothetical protein MHMPM18_002607 [Marteilia pararefringens]